LSVLTRAHFATSALLPDDGTIFDWIDIARDRIATVASRRGLIARDFAATLVASISAGTETLLFHVGDGGVVLLDSTTNQWVIGSWPEHGEYASTTSFLTDEPTAKVRITRIDVPIRGLAVFSDGLERLALRFADGQPHGPFFDGMFRPLLASSASGRDAALSRSLQRFMGSPTINERTDDDKSLIIAVRS
jgi:hypothetical protein